MDNALKDWLKEHTLTVLVRLALWRPKPITPGVSRKDYVLDRELYVTTLAAPVKNLVENLGGRVIHNIWLSGLVIAEIPPSAISILVKSEHVSFITMNRLLKVDI